MSASFPFTTLEEFLFWEDRPAYPWSCFIRLHFTGRLDRAAFEAAVRTVLKRHPLFCAKARMRSGTHMQWVVEDDPQPAITWQSGPVGGPFPPATHLDLRREIGIRFHIVSEGSACNLIIQWHHACCDGAGMLTFIDDLLIAYTMALGTAPDDLRPPPLDPERLVLRGRFGLELGLLIRTVWKQAAGLAGVCKFLGRTPAPILPHRPHADDDPLPAEYPAVLSGRLEATEMASLRRKAAQRKVRLNDLLAAELFLALMEWRARNGVENDGWLRMMVPMNLRTAADRRLPAVCLASFVFLDRRRRDCEDPEGLLRSIHEQMNNILARQLGYTFVFFSRLLNFIPGELRRRARNRRSGISCVFTNIGKYFVHSPLRQRGGRLTAGNVTLEGMDSVAPNRPCTCASFAAGIYAGRLTITLHYDPRPLTGPQAEDLLKSFLQRLRMP